MTSCILEYWSYPTSAGIGSKSYSLKSEPVHAVLIGAAMGCLGFAVDWAVVELNNLKFSGV